MLTRWGVMARGHTRRLRASRKEPLVVSGGESEKEGKRGENAELHFRSGSASLRDIQRSLVFIERV